MMQIKRSLYVLAAAMLIAVLLSIFSRTPLIHAQAPTDCAGVDLVLLIDESASMQDNDKESLRIDAARLAISSLGDNILYSCPDVKHRIAVIGFWDELQGAKDTAVYVNTLVAPTVENFDAWVKQRDQLKVLLDKRKVSNVGTDHLSALKAAAQVLADWRKQPAADATMRRQGVVLVTDGGPCIADLGCADQGDTFDRTAYMDELTRFTDPNGTNFPWRGDTPASVRLWFIGFRDTRADPKFDYLSPDSPWGKMFRPKWEQLVTGHGGTLKVLDASSPQTTNRDIAPKVVDVIDSVTGTSLIRAKCTEPFYVDPYTDKLQVRILKIGSNTNVPLQDVRVRLVYTRPLGKGIFAQGIRQGTAGGSVADYRGEGPNEVYVIQDPAPGEWRIEVTNADECRDLNVSYKPLTVKGSVVKPLSAEAISQFDEDSFSDPSAPIHFEYRLLSGDAITKTKPIMQIPQFPLTVKVDVRSGDKSQQTLELQQGADGQWYSRLPIKVPMAGVYTWSLIGEAPDGQQKKAVRVFEDQGTFKVSQVKRFHIEIVTPGAGVAIPLNRIEGGKQSPVAVKVAARAIDDETGKPLSQRQIQGTSKLSLLEVNLAITSTTPVVSMVYNAVDMQWEAELVAGQTNVPDVAGKQLITVQLNEQGYDKTSYRPAGTNGRSSQVSIDRYRIVPVELTVSPPSFEKPAYKGTAACIGAKVIPIQVDLAVTDAQRKTRLKPADVITGDLTKLASVRLVDPVDNRVIEEGRWQVVETKDGAVLRATLGITNAVAGKFEVQVIPNEKDLRNQYQLLRTDPVLVPVVRSLNFLDNPRTCQGAKFTGFGLLALILGWMIFNFTRRPTGSLELVDTGTQIPYVSTSLGRSLGVLFWPIQKIGIGQKGLGLSSVVVKKSRGEGGRAISVDAYDEEGHTILTGATLTPGEEEVYLTEDITARYS